MKCKAGHDCETSSTEAWAPIKHLPATGGADQLFMRDIFYAATWTWKIVLGLTNIFIWYLIFVSLEPGITSPVLS